MDSATLDRATPEPFGDLLRGARLDAGLTQEALAERAGVSVRAIQALERGRVTPQRDTARRLAAALGLESGALARFEASVRPAPRRRAASAARVAREAPPAPPSTLPLALTSFVGRAQEMAAITALLGATRLLTLVGTGGVGKTRLALEVARVLSGNASAAETHADGIWLVELAALGEGTLVLPAVATALGVRERSGQTLLDSVVAFLQPGRALLLLDNCEHLVVACAQLAEALLRACPRLTILATSREALGIGGERPWWVPSLRLPDSRGLLSDEQALASEAVQLFVQRAQVVRPEFAPRGPQVGLVAHVCRQLDGIPLAIELAAVRLAALPLDQLAARLDDRFRLLSGGSRTAPLRQQTLRATLDWSYDLLGESEQLLLRRLTVFAEGWTLEAAEAVCSDDGIAPEEVLDLLAGLAAKSLVLVEGSAGARYRLLETVRQYGREKLRATGEAARVRERHLDWYLGLAEQAARRIGGPEREGWLERLEAEAENLRAALHWSVEQEDRLEAGLRLTVALKDFWYMRSYASEGRRWLEDLLARTGGGIVSASLRARALDVLALLAHYQGDEAHALALFEAAHALHHGEGDIPGATWSLTWQAMVMIYLGDYQRAMPLLERVLPAHHEHGDQRGVGWTLNDLGTIHQLQGDYARAAELYAESLAAFEEMGDTFGIGYQVNNLAAVARDMGDYGQAQRLYRENLQVRRALRDRARVALRDRARVAVCCEGLAMVAVAGGQPVRAARLLGAAHGLREAIGTRVSVANRAARDRVIADVRAALGEEPCAAAWAMGQVMRLEEAIVYALQEGEPA